MNGQDSNYLYKYLEEGWIDEGDKILKYLTSGFLNNSVPVRFFLVENNQMCCKKLNYKETLL